MGYGRRKGALKSTLNDSRRLEGAGIKLRKGRKRRQPVAHNGAAYAQGEKDASQIDLERQAIDA